MKILFFIRALDLGGSQRQLAALAAGLAARGHQVTVATYYPNAAADETLAAAGVHMVDLQKAGRWDIVRPHLLLRRIIRNEKPDIFYPFLPTQTTVAALLLPLWTKTRLVFGVRAAGMKSAYYDRLSSLIYRLEVWMSARANLIIANARSAREDIIKRGMSGKRIAVVPNGIDTEIARPDDAARRKWRTLWNLASDHFVVGLVARLDPMKDHMNFLNAAARFAALHPDARFVCVGSGPDLYRDSLKNYADSIGLAGRVIWAGKIADARTIYSAFDIATLSSAFGEAFPNAVGEAMASGVPVVSTDVGDTASIVGTLGEIVPPGNPDLLCAGWSKMQRRMADEPSLSRAARERVVNNFSISAMVRQTEKELLEIL